MTTESVKKAVDETARLFDREPERARVSTPPVTATLDDSVSFRIAGTHGEVVTDMPPPMGGKGRAETPGWHLRAALASCVGTMIATRAAQLSIMLNELSITVQSEVDYRGMLGVDEAVAPGMNNLRMEVRIGSPEAGEAALTDIVRWGEAHSPVARTIKAGNLSEATIIAL
jgi:uncharacterized OsmC-like protein